MRNAPRAAGQVAVSLGSCGRLRLFQLLPKTRVRDALLYLPRWGLSNAFRELACTSCRRYFAHSLVTTRSKPSSGVLTSSCLLQAGRAQEQLCRQLRRDWKHTGLRLPEPDRCITGTCSWCASSLSPGPASCSGAFCTFRQPALVWATGELLPRLISRKMAQRRRADDLYLPIPIPIRTAPMRSGYGPAPAVT